MPAKPPSATDVSPLTLNRLCLYLRSLRRLEADGVSRISSQDLARRFNLSAAQIRKDLAQFGAFGIRGAGYDVSPLIERLDSILRLDRRHPVIVVGMGNLGSALACYLGFNHGSFEVVAGVDNDPGRVGREVGGFRIEHTDHLARVVRDSGAEIGVLAVPAKAAQQNYDLLVEAGIRGVLNFAPTRVQPVPEVPLKDVDLRIHLEELAYFLPPSDTDAGDAS
ncbi:MAG: redox-sensing transcriptional repressor Rex [Acidobacteria bacterium]|nr:redox-sensing transcriptional repressor Rex [Acidobacteriota bacterium]